MRFWKASMATEVKICGLSTTDMMAAALDAGADYVGLVFYPKSPRHVGLDQARALADQARGRARIVALTVDAPDEALQAMVSALKPDFIQAHGAESPARVEEITRRFAPVIKAIAVKSADDIAAARAYRDLAEMVLFDAKAPETLENALPGGNGLSFDWSLLSTDGRPRRFMLSGGLTPQNVARAISMTAAPIVDVSSGVESHPGLKDARLIRNFIEAARSAR
jgi:phosphoribosylanthranilate isomerase